jgi:SSS family solute:Na+ symporter
MELRNTIPPEFFHWEGGKGWVFTISTMFAFMLGETFAPSYATRFCVGKNMRATKFGITGAGIFLAILFPAILFFIALYARFFFPDIDSEMALPKTILRLNNPYIGGIIIAALMSAVMSSADSILNSSTAIFVKDMYEHYFLGKKLGETKKGLAIARIFSVVLGLVGMLMALLLPNVIDLLLLTYTLWAPGIIVPVLVGVFSKKKGKAHNMLIFITIILSLLITFVFNNINFWLFEQPAVWGVLSSAVLYFTGRLVLIKQIRRDNGL